ncbi:MAG: ATP-binding protein [Spirochaetaceae bacterium]|nr:ATP-binding protein [Spirochaetaceae bacterium]
MARSPITVIVGPRQCGKTTLARVLPSDDYFDLEDPRSLARLEEPQTTLERLTGTVVIDEVQRKPELMPLLRYLVDQSDQVRYLLLGSASPDLIRGSAETLAGRVSYHELGPFLQDEIGVVNWRNLWLRGGFPRSFLAPDDRASFLWREDFMRSYLERDIPQLGISIPAETLRRFWVMISHYHGQILNLSELGRSFGVSDHTVRRYLDILVGTFMIRLLPPWYANVGKRLVKAPKLYVRDSGVFHSLQGISTPRLLDEHPKLGASWEGFALEQAVRLLGIPDPYFWRTHTGAEIDLLWFTGGKTWGMEFKYSDAPRISRGLRVSMDDLRPEHVWIVYPGPKSYELDSHVSVIPLEKVAALADQS